MSIDPAVILPAGLSYPPVAGNGDEVRDNEGNILPHWSYLLESIAELGPEAFSERQAKALRILRDDGATYNIYSDAKSPSRIWNLDLVPNIISSDEWGTIEAGLQERGELFNLLLRDIYGPGKLLRQGIIPAEALFSHRGFLRACHGITVPGEHELILHGVDLIRDDDGKMLVIGDRTQSPSGAGYALENRTVMSRVFPSLFRDSHVHRLAAFFQQLRNKLISLSPHSSRSRIAVLTPGPRNETYFEHAYLANYLGFYLVQSDDLVVRNGFLWMKSLDGLNRVDVLLRRVDDWYCDPVELRSDSRLGVAGLLEAVRAGNLIVANPLGSGVLENPVFLRYLPEISKALLGRELRFPSVQTHWCGEPDDLAYVLEHLPELVIKPIYRTSGISSSAGALLTQAELVELRLRILANPAQYVAQPVMAASYLPSFQDSQLLPRPAILRSFAVASNNSYSIMPGGLTRVGGTESEFIISSQSGANSKDTWVVASEPERLLESNSRGDDLQVREAENINLPSRVLENLYWMGRYAERAEASLRILRTTFMLLNGEEPLTPRLRQKFRAAVAKVTTTVLVGDLISDQDLVRQLQDGAVLSSIANNLNSMLFCADETKELLSSDTYRVINDIRDALADLNSTFTVARLSAPEEALDPLVTALMALSGLNHESMIRGFGWRFMELGRRLERATQSSALMNCLLSTVLPEPEQSRVNEALLLTLEGLISYRRRYGARTAIQTSLDLVLLDGDNPRSIIYQLTQMLAHVRKLPNSKGYLHELPPAERIMVEGSALVRLSSLNDMCADVDGTRLQLKNVLTELEALLLRASDMITDRYFDHREQSQQLVSSQWEGV